MKDGFGILKTKLKGFYNNFPYNSTIESVRIFIGSFVAIYNWALKNGLS